MSQAKAVPQTLSLETIKQRVKADMLWVVISVAIALAAGLAAGNLIKF